MLRLLSWLVVNTLALGAAVWLFDGISLGPGTQTEQLVELVVVGAIFGLVTGVVRPVIRFVSFPLIILTLGLALLVINALMLLLTGAIADAVALGFEVSGFWTAVLGAIVISLAALVLESLLPDHDRR